MCLLRLPRPAGALGDGVASGGQALNRRAALAVGTAAYDHRVGLAPACYIKDEVLLHPALDGFFDGQAALVGLKLSVVGGGHVLAGYLFRNILAVSRHPGRAGRVAVPAHEAVFLTAGRGGGADGGAAEDFYGLAGEGNRAAGDEPRPLLRPERGYPRHH